MVDVARILLELLSPPDLPSSPSNLARHPNELLLAVKFAIYRPNGLDSATRSFVRHSITLDVTTDPFPRHSDELDLASSPFARRPDGLDLSTCPFSRHSGELELGPGSSSGSRRSCRLPSFTLFPDDLDRGPSDVILGRAPNP